MMKAIPWLAAALALAVTSCHPEKKQPAAEVGTAHDQSGWTTDLEKGFADAKAAKKAVLVEFTGSDWCPPCIAMRKNVFSKKEFVSAASQNFILVELDFPNGDPAVKAKNEPIAEKYKIEGFPTVVLFNHDGKEISRFIASEYPQVDAFLEHLDKELKKSGS